MINYERNYLAFVEKFYIETESQYQKNKPIYFLNFLRMEIRWICSSNLNQQEKN